MAEVIKKMDPGLNKSNLLLTSTSEKDTFNYHDNTIYHLPSFIKPGGSYVKMQR